MSEWIIAVNVILLLIGAGAVLAARERVAELERELEAEWLENSWRRVLGCRPSSH